MHDYERGRDHVSDNSDDQIVLYVRQTKIIVEMELYKQEMVNHVMMEIATTTMHVIMPVNKHLQEYVEVRMEISIMHLLITVQH